MEVLFCKKRLHKKFWLRKKKNQKTKNWGGTLELSINMKWWRIQIPDTAGVGANLEASLNLGKKIYFSDWVFRQRNESNRYSSSETEFLMPKYGNNLNAHWRQNWSIALKPGLKVIFSFLNPNSDSWGNWRDVRNLFPRLAFPIFFNRCSLEKLDLFAVDFLAAQPAQEDTILQKLPDSCTFFWLC